VRVVEQDHFGNVRRAHATMRDVVANPNALALIGGLHSPPYMSHGAEINAAGLPTLLPWSAAAPLTRRATDGANFIFRLSVDDAKASRFLVRSSVREFGCRNIALLLLDTSWGRTNRGPMIDEIVSSGASVAEEIFFKVELGSAAAKAIARDLTKSSADCAIMLSNAKQGAYIVNALHKTGANLSLFSHWGIAGGDFAENTSHAARTQLNLRVLQTCNVSEHVMASKQAEAALAAARAVSADTDLSELTDIPATVGFVHAYDLTLTLIAAAEQASQTSGWENGIGAMRIALKEALEDLTTPVAGIMDLYAPPFQPYSVPNPDAHEALDQRHLCFNAFDADGRLPWTVRVSGS
jgi:branched-chain amino acid transport system substrate-binding protein